jgi:gamma-glutamylcyclotransferase (GGCT)/AIG2-like uncharacterized protein YtfP
MQQDGVKLLGSTETAPAFTMTSMGGFPIVKTFGKTPIQIEVYEVTSRNALDRINRLEGYSGKRGHSSNWYNTVDVDTPYGQAEMFIMSPEQYPHLQVIESGDWLKR